jgi:F0F1-type ATP synthase membrane subunit c/vacuolar-type H+-ATPase subunit K
LPKATKKMNAVNIIHNILRWAVLLFGLLAVIKAIGGVASRKNYTNADNKTSLLFMIFCDVQLVLGLILYFGGDWFNMLKSNTADVMKNSATRFFAMEHIVMMIIAWVLVHLGRSMVKRADVDVQKHKRSLIYFGVAIIIILAMIPWAFRSGIGRPWFPQF